MVRMAGDDSDRVDGEGLLNGHRPDEDFVGPDDDDLGAWLSGLSAVERANVDRAARERDIDEGRAQFGRYARAHPGALDTRADGGLVDADGVLDALVAGAQSFAEERTEAARHERELLKHALDESLTLANEKRWVDPSVATFRGYVPNGGVKTNRDNEYVLTINVSWSDRDELHRIIETIPMELKVTIERVDG